MAHISMKGPGTVGEISEQLRARMLEGEYRCQLLDSVKRNGLEMLVFNGYSFRAGICNLSILLSAMDDIVTVDAVATANTDDIFGFAESAEYDFAGAVYAAVQDRGFEVVEKSDRPEPQLLSKEFFTAEPSEETLDINELMRLGAQAKRKADDARPPETKKYEPEPVKLGREEKKGLFGRKHNKPDWEY